MPPLTPTFNDFSRAEERVREAYGRIQDQEEDGREQLIGDFLAAYNDMAKIGNYLLFLSPDITMREVLQIDRKRDEWRPVYERYRQIAGPG